MMEFSRYVLLFGLFLLFCGVVHGLIIQQLPVTQSNGLVIESPVFTQLEMGVNNTFLWNVYNLSDGIILDGSVVSCSFRVVNSTGSVVFFDGDCFDNVTLNSSVFLGEGIYSRLIQCNSSLGYGDFNELSFKVGNGLSVVDEGSRVPTNDLSGLTLILGVFAVLFILLGVYLLVKKND